MYRTIRYDLLKWFMNSSRLFSFSNDRRCDDLADTVTQPYEELNAEMKAFDERQKSRGSNQCEASYDEDKLNQCNSNTKTKK